MNKTSNHFKEFFLLLCGFYFFLSCGSNPQTEYALKLYDSNVFGSLYYNNYLDFSMVFVSAANDTFVYDLNERESPTDMHLQDTNLIFCVSDSIIRYSFLTEERACLLAKRSIFSFDGLTISGNRIVHESKYSFDIYDVKRDSLIGSFDMTSDSGPLSSNCVFDGSTLYFSLSGAFSGKTQLWRLGGNELTPTLLCTMEGTVLPISDYYEKWEGILIHEGIALVQLEKFLVAIDIETGKLIDYSEKLAGFSVLEKEAKTRIEFSSGFVKPVFDLKTKQFIRSTQ